MFTKKVYLFAIFILFLTQLLAAQHRSKGLRPTAQVLNPVLDPTACGRSDAPTWCAGSEIGAWTNAAIASFSGTCGELSYSSGTYAQTITIIKPRCIKMIGEAAHATILNWTPTTGWAVVVADGYGQNNYPEGAIEDITFNGPGPSTTTGGIYIGGDPAGIISPSGSYGDHHNFNRVRITAFGTGIQWGNNAWDDTFTEGIISGDGTGVFAPTGVTGSGESVSFVNTSIQNNTVSGINLVGYSDFYFTNSRFDYNAMAGEVSGAAQAFFDGCHFEQGDTAAILTLNASDARAHIGIFGGSMLFTGSSAAEMINVPTGNLGALNVDGLWTYQVNPVSYFVNWGAVGTGGGGLSLSNLHVNTAFTSGLSSGWPSAGSVISSPGTVTATYFVGANSGTGTPFSLGNGAWLGWNTNLTAEGDIWNTWSGAANATPAFNFYANIGGTSTVVGSILRNGVFQTFGGLNVGANLVLPPTLTGYHGSSGTKVQLSDGSGPAGYEAVFASDGSLTKSTAGSTGHATCWKAVGEIGYCSTAVSSSGTCTCN